MKRFDRSSPIYFLFLFLIMQIGLVGCQQDNKNPESLVALEAIPAGEYAKGHVNQILTSYLTLKKNLVATAPTKAQQAALDLSEVLSAVDTTQMNDQEKGAYSQYVNGLAEATTQMAQSNDIEAQRTAFETITKQVLALVQVFDPTEKTLYYQYCPMAFDDKGAYWISGEKEIRNPYFGDRMLKCGRVVAEF